MSDEPKPKKRRNNAESGRLPATVQLRRFIEAERQSKAAAAALAKHAALDGVLPHEWLLKVVRGEPVAQRRWKVIYDSKGKPLREELVEEQVYPDLQTRIDAAKAAAPYFAPKLAVHTISPNTATPDQVAKLFESIAAKLPV